MARWVGTTKERGYGSDHQKLRAQRVAVYRCGDPCAIGGEPLNLPPAMLDLAHDHVNGGYLPGLSCRYHNRREGAQRANRQTGFVPASVGSNVHCRTCGQPYNWSARICEMCGAHYHPSYREQRTCGRVCGVELRRRNHGTGGRPFLPRPPCAWCGKPCPQPSATYCSGEHSRAAREWLKPEPATWPSSRLQHYTCRYCGTSRVTKATGTPRQVCPARECQLARLSANNLRIRNGLTREEADVQVVSALAGEVATLTVRSAQWRSAREW
jgi:hypothetical protein